MIYGPYCYISISSYPTCPAMGQLVTSHCTMQSVTYCCFISDEPCAQFLDYHSYLTCLYLPYKFPPEFRLSKFIQPDHFAPLFSNVLSPHFIPYLSPFHIFSPFFIASPCSPILSVMDSPVPCLETIPYPLIAPSEPHWVYALIKPHCSLFPTLAVPLAYHQYLQSCR